MRTSTGRLFVTISANCASAWFVPLRLRRTEMSVRGGASEVFAAQVQGQLRYAGGRAW